MNLKYLFDLYLNLEQSKIITEAIHQFIGQKYSLSMKYGYKSAVL